MEDSNVVLSTLYPKVKSSLDKNSNKFLNNIGKFFNTRHKELYEIAPYDRIFFNKNDIEDLFNSLSLNEIEIKNIISNMYYYNMDNIMPKCARDPYVQVCMCAIRYYLEKKNNKNAEVVAIYLCFTGKFYASIHGNLWRFLPNKQVLDFVVNNMLTDKFDLKKEGTVFGAVKKLSITWLSTYNDLLLNKETSDDDFRLAIQQLRDRLKSFLKNIAKLYYSAYENKNYLNYETDSMDEDNFRLTVNDAATAARITEAAVDILNSQRVDAALCNKCKNENVSALEVNNIMNAILMEKENITKLRRVINIIICVFMSENKGKRVGSMDFIKYTLSPKSNTKNELLIEQKNTITNLLDTYWPNYRKRKSRIATANNYYRAVLMYLTFTICKVA